jgi:predicted nucleotidyltransferase
MLSDFKREITNSDISYMTSKWIVEKIPFIFSNDFENYIKWKEILAKKIGVDSKAIVLTGSSSVGFSLNPEKKLRAFTPESDIDIAIISQHYFDLSWHFLRNVGTKRYDYSKKENDAIDDHRLRLIYWGTIATDKIIQILPFGKIWVKALNEMALIEPTKDRIINIRIYKDFEALRAYHLNNLKTIKDNLISK